MSARSTAARNHRGQEDRRRELFVRSSLPAGEDRHHTQHSFPAAGADVEVWTTLRAHFISAGKSSPYQCWEELSVRSSRRAKVCERAYFIHFLQGTIKAGRRMDHVDTLSGCIEDDTSNTTLNGALNGRGSTGPHVVFRSESLRPKTRA